MAGFQQAANALTGVAGTIANRVGLYGELVGKNREYRAQLEEQNAALKKLNEDLEANQDELEATKADLAVRNEQLDQNNKILAEYKERKLKQGREGSKRHREKVKAAKAAEDERAKSETGRLDRALSNNQAYMSKAMALSLLYGDFASGSGGI